MMTRRIRILTVASVLVMNASAQVFAAEIVKSDIKKSVIVKKIVKSVQKAVTKPEATATSAKTVKPVTLVTTASSSNKLLERTPLTRLSYVKVGFGLCDAVVPVPATYNNHSYDAAQAIRRCQRDVSRLETAGQDSVTKKDLYEMTLRICSGHAMESAQRKYDCYSKAQVLMPYDSAIGELKICGLSKKFNKAGKEIRPTLAKKEKVVACIEEQMTCSAAFPELKQGVRDRLARVEKIQRELKVTHADAQERWGVLTTSEVTAGNVDSARACLLKTMNTYAQLRHPSTKAASVRESVQVVLQELHATFPEVSETSRPENHFDTVQ